MGSEPVQESGRLEKRDDENTVRAFLGGEAEAFDRLVKKYRLTVYRICYRFTGNHHDADDQAQEVFLRAFRGIAGFRGKARFSTWLYRICVNTCLNWVSRRKKHPEVLPENIPDPGPGQLENLTREERCHWIRGAVEKLPAIQRATLVLRVYQDLSHREIAEILDSPVGTVKANLYFALKNLRKVVENASGRDDSGGPGGKP